MTELETAEATLETFKRLMADGYPYLLTEAFISNPGLDLYVQAALESWVHAKRAAEQSKPARRVSLSDDPNWRPSSMAPVMPGSKEWVDVEDADKRGS